MTPASPRNELRDPATGLASPALQHEHLRLALKRAQRDGSHVALVFIEVDNLPKISEHWGPATVDRMQRDFARRLQAGLRATDVVSEFDRGEFTIVCEDLHQPGHVGSIVRRVDGLLHEPFVIEDEAIELRGSIGSAVSPGAG